MKEKQSPVAQTFCGRGKMMLGRKAVMRLFIAACSSVLILGMQVDRR
jgi:hypothetical protein